MKIEDGIYAGAFLYGPYYRKDGRQHVILIWHGGNNKIIKRKSVSYPKFLMERYLGRKLNEDETIDHVDRDFTNNDFNNLRIIERSKHTKEDVVRVKCVIVKCIDCGTEMLRKSGSIDYNSRRGMAGPFCKKCAGEYGSDIQNGKRNKLPPQEGLPVKEREYYKNDKNL